MSWEGCSANIFIVIESAPRGNLVWKGSGVYPCHCHYPPARGWQEPRTHFEQTPPEQTHLCCSRWFNILSINYQEGPRKGSAGRWRLIPRTNIGFDARHTDVVFPFINFGGISAGNSETGKPSPAGPSNNIVGETIIFELQLANNHRQMKPRAHCLLLPVLQIDFNYWTGLREIGLARKPLYAVQLHHTFTFNRYITNEAKSTPVVHI